MRNRPGDHLHPTVREYVNSRAIARTYDAHFADNLLFQYDCLFLGEHLVPPGPVLDLGCGTGRHLVYLAKRGFRVFGLDLNPHMLEEARRNLRAIGCGARLLRADFHALPLAATARYSGLLLMFSTLGLVRSREMRKSLLASLRPLLAPAGRLILHVHNLHYRRPPGKIERISRRLQTLAGAAEPGDFVMPAYRGIQDLFLHSFTAGEICALLAEAGYELQELRPLNDRRDGPYAGDDAGRNANGFLVAASAG